MQGTALFLFLPAMLICLVAANLSMLFYVCKEFLLEDLKIVLLYSKLHICSYDRNKLIDFEREKERQVRQNVVPALQALTKEVVKLCILEGL